MCNLINTHTHIQVSLIPPWEDQCEWHRMTRMTGPDCAVMCNLINTHTHKTHTHTHTLCTNRSIDSEYWLWAQSVMSVFSLLLLFFVTQTTGFATAYTVLLRAKRVLNRRSWKKSTQKRAPSPTAAVQLLADHILEDYCTYSPSHLFWRQKSFRRAIASSIHAGAVGSA